MDEFNIGSSSDSSGSEESLCKTALPFTSDIQTINDSTSDTTTAEEEEMRNLKTMKDHVEAEARRGETTRLLFEKTSTMKSLPDWLAIWGPRPISNYRAAAILKDIASGLSLIHSMKFSFGPNLIDAIYLDKNWRAFVYLSHGLMPGKVSGRWMMEDDMFRLGEILHRLLTGKLPYFDEEKILQPVGKTPFPIDQTGIKLAYSLLSCHPKLRPTAGTIIFNPWTDLANHNGQGVNFLF